MFRNLSNKYGSIRSILIDTGSSISHTTSQTPLTKMLFDKHLGLIHISVFVISLNS